MGLLFKIYKGVWKLSFRRPSTILSRPPVFLSRGQTKQRVFFRSPFAYSLSLQPFAFQSWALRDANGCFCGGPQDHPVHNLRLAICSTQKVVTEGFEKEGASSNAPQKKKHHLFWRRLHLRFTNTFEPTRTPHDSRALHLSPSVDPPENASMSCIFCASWKACSVFSVIWRFTSPRHIGHPHEETWGSETPSSNNLLDSKRNK